MRTLLVSTQRSWGGGENLLSQLATGLQRRGVQVRLAAPAGTPLDDWARREGSIEAISLPGRGRGPAALWRLRRAAREVETVVLNDPHAISYGGVALTGLATPKIGIRHTCFRVNSGWKHNRLLDRVVCVAEAAREECLKAGVLREKTEVIHAGLDRVAPTAEAIDAAHATLHADNPNGEPIVLAIGSLIWVKGFDTLIRAVAASAASPRPWRLAIAGEGPDRPQLEALVEELGVADRVRLLGFRDDVPALLAASDAFASASHREGLSLVLVEAMMAGTPVVATPVGGNGEALRINQPGASEVARAVVPDDPDGTAEAIQHALEPTDENAARVEAARDWSTEHFTIDRMADDYLALFERMLAASRQQAA